MMFDQSGEEGFDVGGEIPKRRAHLYSLDKVTDLENLLYHLHAIHVIPT